MSQLNIFGEEISECCTNPITGFTRDGFCSHHPLDHGLHLVCALMTKDFLEFSRFAQFSSYIDTYHGRLYIYQDCTLVARPLPSRSV